MSNLLDNPIILACILEHLIAAKDIASLCAANHTIQDTAELILHHSHIYRLTFAHRTRLKSKHLQNDPFKLIKFRFLTLLNLSNTGITVAIVRSLILGSRTLKFLQIVDCQKVDVGSLINLFRSIRRSRDRNDKVTEDKSQSVCASLVCLDCWGIGGLLLDYKYQNRQEWFFESYCSDNNNLRTLLTEAEAIGVDLNIEFCPAADHDNVTDIRYLPAARQLWGLQRCPLVPLEHQRPFSVCETCVLRSHNRAGNPKHECRHPVAIDINSAAQPDCNVV